MGDTTLRSQGALGIRRGAAKWRRAHRPALQAGPPNLLRRGSLCLFVSVAMFFVVRVGLR